MRPCVTAIAPGWRSNRARPRIWWAAAAAALLAAIATWQVSYRPSPATAWQVAGLEGTVAAGRPARRSRHGDAQRPGAAHRRRLPNHRFRPTSSARSISAPSSELRAATNQHVLLDRGTLHAFIWARPGMFEVDTPSARAIDLGCEYTINVDGSGDGLLRVSRGWVAFRHQGHESFIPAGAAMRHTQARRPRHSVLRRYVRGAARGVGIFEAATPPRRSTAILAAARPHDGLTLWHLLTRVPAADRARVFDRFAALVEVPSDVSREGVLRLDAPIIDRCWDALVLENTEWWRGWERKW